MPCPFRPLIICLLLLAFSFVVTTSQAQADKSQEYTTKKIVTLSDSTVQPLVFINGKLSSLKDMQLQNQASFEKIDVLKGETAIAKYGDKGKNGVVEITLKASLKDTIPAIFPGGINGWRKYIEQTLKYPVAALEKNVQGTVRVQMLIDKEGKISEVKALNDPGEGLAEEAMRVVKVGPNWTPATIYGKPVDFRFVQTISFQLGGTFRQVASQISMSPFGFNQSIIIKTKKLYKEKPVIAITTTEDLSGINVLGPDMKSYFLNKDEAMQQFGILVNEKGFVVPEEMKVVYTDNNGVATDSYQNLKFVGGFRNFRFFSLFKKGSSVIDTDKQPVLILNGKEVTAAEIQPMKPSFFRGSNLLRLQDDAAIAKFGEKGKNGILFLSTKLPYPDNYLYLLNGKESSNEEIAKLPPGLVDSTMIMPGSKRTTDLYGEKAKYGLVRAHMRDTVKKTTDIVFSKATTNAMFPGGEEGWKKYLAENLRYPDAAKKNNIEATVRVRVIISADGTVSKAMANNDPGYGMAMEANRLLKDGPKWTPAIQNGKNVPFTTTMVIPFKLDPVNYN